MMEEVMSSCIMLAVSLHTPIKLDGIIRDEDLNGEGIIRDPHITVIYGKEVYIDKDEVLPSIEYILGSDEYESLTKFMSDYYKFKVFDLFYLDSFDNEDSSYLVLRLKSDSLMFSRLSKIANGLSSRYEVESKYGDYKPHITLAELKPGEARKYIHNNILTKVLNDSKMGFEDFVISYERIKDKYEKWSITTYHTIERLFREEE